jgi:hypothetical protein
MKRPWQRIIVGLLLALPGSLLIYFAKPLLLGDEAISIGILLAVLPLIVWLALSRPTIDESKHKGAP